MHTSGNKTTFYIDHNTGVGKYDDDYYSSEILDRIIVRNMKQISKIESRINTLSSISYQHPYVTGIMILFYFASKLFLV
jgi:hypothetical protein